MTRLLAISVLSTAIAAAGLATSANAQWNPIGPFTLTNIGPIQVSLGLTFNCGLAGSGQVFSGPSGGAPGPAQVNSVGLTALSFLCPLVTFNNLPYNMLRPNPTTVVFQNVNVTAITGSCAGNLMGSFNPATGQFTFINATIPATTGSGSCVVNGVVGTVPALF